MTNKFGPSNSSINIRWSDEWFAFFPSKISWKRNVEHAFIGYYYQMIWGEQNFHLLIWGRRELLGIGGGNILDLRKLRQIWTRFQSSMICNRQWSTSLAACKVAIIHYIFGGKLCIVFSWRKSLSYTLTSVFFFNGWFLFPLSKMKSHEVPYRTPLLAASDKIQHLYRKHEIMIE